MWAGPWVQAPRVASILDHLSLVRLQKYSSQQCFSKLSSCERGGGWVFGRALLTHVVLGAADATRVAVCAQLAHVAIRIPAAVGVARHIREGHIICHLAALRLGDELRQRRDL